MIVAIDGPAGVGKSSIASEIARRHGFFNLNSGNFYRAVALLLLRNEISLEQEKAIVDAAESARLEILNARLFLEGKDVEDLLHSDDVDNIVAQVSAIVPIRHIINKKLRETGTRMDLVAEGRDMTTVVFPQAEVKVFLDASAQVRAERRFNQGVSSLSFKEILEGIEKRDKIDRNKEEGSLKIAEDAIYIDTSSLTLQQVCEKVSGKIRELK